MATDLVAQNDYSSEIKLPDENSQFVRSEEEKVSDQSQIDKSEPIGAAEKLSPELELNKRIPQESELPYSRGEFVTKLRALNEEATKREESPLSYFSPKTEDKPLTSGDNVIIDNSLESNQNVSV